MIESLVSFLALSFSFEFWWLESYFVTDPLFDLLTVSATDSSVEKLVFLTYEFDLNPILPFAC